MEALPTSVRSGYCLSVSSNVTSLRKVHIFYFRKRQREENIRRAALEIHTALLSAGAADFITPN